MPSVDDLTLTVWRSSCLSQHLNFTSFINNFLYPHLSHTVIQIESLNLYSCVMTIALWRVYFVVHCNKTSMQLVVKRDSVAIIIPDTQLGGSGIKETDSISIFAVAAVHCRLSLFSVHNCLWRGSLPIQSLKVVPHGGLGGCCSIAVSRMWSIVTAYVCRCWSLSWWKVVATISDRCYRLFLPVLVDVNGHRLYLLWALVTGRWSKLALVSIAVLALVCVVVSTSRSAPWCLNIQVFICCLKGT